MQVAEWRARNAVRLALYAALVAYVAIRAWRGLTGGEGLVGLLDAYDAALWILCFAVIELNVFDHETSEDGPAPLDASPASP